jgi:hypothetical protein
LLAIFVWLHDYYFSQGGFASSKRSHSRTPARPLFVETDTRGCTHTEELVVHACSARQITQSTPATLCFANLSATSKGPTKGTMRPDNYPKTHNNFSRPSAIAQSKWHERQQRPCMQHQTNNTITTGFAVFRKLVVDQQRADERYNAPRQRPNNQDKHSRRSVVA